MMDQQNDRLVSFRGVDGRERLAYANQLSPETLGALSPSAPAVDPSTAATPVPPPIQPQLVEVPGIQDPNAYAQAHMPVQPPPKPEEPKPLPVQEESPVLLAKPPPPQEVPPPAEGVGLPNFAPVAPRPPEQDALLHKQLAQAEKDIAAQRSVFQQQAELETVKAADTGRVLREQQRQQDLLQAQQLKAHQQRQATMDSELERYRVLRAAADSKEIDPNRFTASRSTGATVATAISIAMGGMAQVLGHMSSNPAMTIVSDAIDRDILAQKAALAQGHEAAQGQLTLIGQLRQRGLDAEQSEQMARVILHDNAQKQLAVLATEYAGPEAQVGAQKLSQEMAQQQHQYINSLQQAAWARTFQVQAHNDQMDAQRQAHIAAYLQHASTSDDATRKRVVPGIGLAINEQSAKDLKAGSTHHEGAVNALKAIIEMKPGTRFELTNPKDTAKLKTARELVIRGLQNQYEMGVLQKYERDQLEEIVPDPTKHDITGHSLELFRSLLDQENGNWDAAMRAHLDPSAPGYPTRTFTKRRL